MVSDVPLAMVHPKVCHGDMVGIAHSYLYQVPFFLLLIFRHVINKEELIL